MGRGTSVRKPQGDRPFEGDYESEHAKALRRRTDHLPEALDTWFELNTIDDSGGMSEAKMPLGKHFHPERSRGPTKG